MSVSMPCARCRSFRTCRRVLCNSQTLKTRQIRHVFIRRRPRLAGCYAIEVDHRLKGAFQPDCVLDYRSEPRIRGNHLVLPLYVAQHEMREHRSPYLPFDRILVLSEERLELKRLLELLECVAKVAPPQDGLQNADGRQKPGKGVRYCE